MSNDRNNILNQIMDSDPMITRELAERMFEAMRADEQILYSDQRGLYIVDGVDLLAVALAVE